jgi:hypothetical protein
VTIAISRYHSAPSDSNSQGKGVICISTYTYGLGRPLPEFHTPKSKKESYQHPIRPPLFRRPRNTGPSNWPGGSFRLNGQPHLSISTTRQPTYDIFVLPEHKSSPPLYLPSVLDSLRSFPVPSDHQRHQRKCRLIAVLGITLPNFRKLFDPLPLSRSCQKTSDALQSHLHAVSSQAGTPKQSSKDSQNLQPLPPL